MPGATDPVTFVALPGTTTGARITTADVDLDGRQEILIVGRDGGDVLVFEADGTESGRRSIRSASRESAATSQSPQRTRSSRSNATPLTGRARRNRRRSCRKLSPHPLDGIRVADFSRVLAGPFCARVLADLGAEVVKIEPPDGDLSRRLGPRRGGMSGYFMQQNCGKRNVSIDLKSAAGRDLAAAIAGSVDVLIENFRPGVMDDLGLGPALLRKRHPALVYCSISGFGHASPWRDQRAFAGIAHATTGVLYRQAHAWSEAPHDSVLAIGDTVTGLQAAIAILAALRLRERTGRGQFIDMAMHDALLSVQEAANFHLFGDEATEHDFLCSWMFRCGDDYLVMPSDPRAMWSEITTAMERSDLASDPQYDSYEKRSERLEELEALIQDWALDQPSADAVVARFHAHGLPAARVGKAVRGSRVRANAALAT